MPKNKQVGKYLLGPTLGIGSYSKVKEAEDTITGRKVAIKILDKKKVIQADMGSNLKKEISVLKKFNHPSITKLYEVLASDTKIFLVCELLPKGELFDCVVSKGKFEGEVARKYFRQLIEGIEYCHQHQVCHRDLKPENILLDAHDDIKISDFGLCAEVEDESILLQTTCGTPNYVAPEVLMDKGYNGYKADVWSTGVILYVMLAGFLPFDEPTMPELFRKILRADLAYPKWFSEGSISLINRILQPDPAKRPSVQQIKNHPWYKEGDAAVIVEEMKREPSTDSVESIRSETYTEWMQKSAAREDADGPSLQSAARMNAFELINMITRCLKEFCDSHQVRHFTAKGSKMSCSHGPVDAEIRFDIQVYEINPSLHLISYSRLKGDHFASHALYAELKEYMVKQKPEPISPTLDGLPSPRVVADSDSEIDTNNLTSKSPFHLSLRSISDEQEEAQSP